VSHLLFSISAVTLQMLFYYIIPAVHGTISAQSNHAKHAVDTNGLTHEVSTAADL